MGIWLWWIKYWINHWRKEKKQDKSIWNYETDTYRKRWTSLAQRQTVFIIKFSLGNRKYRQFYKQTLRMPSWFARQLKQIAGNNSALTNALAERRSILEVMKFEL
jgi:hypothetical protein